MRLVDLDAKNEYTLDNKYNIKPRLSAYWEYEGLIVIDDSKIQYGQCSNCHSYVFKDKFCSNCGAIIRSNNNG